MLGSADPAFAVDAPVPRVAQRLRAALRLGIPGSLLLHALVLFLVLRGIDLSRTHEPPLHVFPVDLVQIADPIAVPAGKPQAAAGPREKAPAAPRPRAPKLASLAPPAPVRAPAIAPPGEQPSTDPLQERLQAFAKLRLPDSGAIASNDSASAKGAGGTDAATTRGYTVKDLVRAQVERRWNLDLNVLRGRRFVIPIRVRLRRDGTVLSAEIVERERSQLDRAYHSVALSARNAVLLSSPLALPAGRYQDVMELTLDLDPRDTVR